MRSIDAIGFERELIADMSLCGKKISGDEAYNRALLLLAGAPTLTPPNEWVSVEERLPEEKQRVIVRCERIGTSVGWILWGEWKTDIGPDAGEVTHWMPLPAPPDRRPPEGGEDT